MKRKRLLFMVGYLLIVTAVVIIALVISYQAEIIRAQAMEVERAAYLQQVEVERNQTQTELDERTEQLQLVVERNAELEELLINRARTYEIVTTGLQVAAARDADVQLLSRAGRQTVNAVNMPVIQPSGFTAKTLERAFEQMAPGMVGTGEAFLAAEEEYGINALVLAGICHLESGGGMSGYAQRRNNLAGLGAYTSNPDNAFHFDSRADSIFFLAELLATHYAPGGRFFGGSFDLAGIGVRYACDPGWASKVAGRIEQLARAAVEDPGALMAAATASQNATGDEM